MDTIGARLAAARKHRVLTQGELARAAGITLLTVSRIETGVLRRGPQPSTVRRLARALGVDPEWLLSGDDPTPGSQTARSGEPAGER